MTLTEYDRRRTFDDTPEPHGKIFKGRTMDFVVQKHAASHLHYDFRLSIGGVLKSWAIPKGPSMNPKLKRLALMVEDHPYDYRHFEGVIPEGNYGAGTVMVWDNGSFELANDSKRAKHSTDAMSALDSGKIKFTLNGKKLKGKFALWRTGTRADNKWLLKKMNDEYATTEDVLERDRSVISKKTIEELSEMGDTDITEQKEESQHITEAPELFSPMLATLVNEPVSGSEWLYEVKWDGYRAIAFIDKGKVDIRSRNNKSFNEKFYPITRALEQWDVKAVVDGEIVVINSRGIADFSALQNWRSEADGQLLYVIFDILYLNDQDLSDSELVYRREILKKLLPESDLLRFSETVDASGKAFFGMAKEMGLEGIIAKRKKSRYYPGKRSQDWLKIKTNKRQEVVIGGFTRNENTSKLFSALLIGVYSEGQLTYTGKVGTGFTASKQKELMAKFKPLIRKTSPFRTVPDVNKPSRFRPHPPGASVTWIKPKLVCEIQFSELTREGVMRHPSFLGLRDDKEPEEVMLETLCKSVKKKDLEILSKKRIIVPPVNKARKTLLNPSEDTQVKKINGHDIRFSNLSKVFWPQEKISKRDLINYYYQVAPFMMPYLKDRPHSLNRHPNGIKGKSFFQKDVTGKVPDWIPKYRYYSDPQKKEKHFLVCSNESDLLYMVSLGCIEINPWSSRIDRPDHPDWCVIDIDPDKNSFDKVIDVARMVHEVLDDLNIPNYCKTSGSTGLHIYMPMGGKYTYHQSKEFARAIVTVVQKEMPRTTTIERPVSKRRGRIYLDFLQNRPQATVAAPYCVRPKPGAPVSMPLLWDEVKHGLSIRQFTLSNCPERIREVGDIFQPVLGKGVDMENIALKMR